MGQLPPERITKSDAFSNSGVDFAGPFECKCVGHRSTVKFKVYVAIFICLASRAVYIEVVSSLTTAAFLDTLKRFIARRGLPKTIFSDNGRTFVGAKNYLNHLDLTSSDIDSFASIQGITWKFIPPRAPHQGGLWEAAVKSAKYHFSRVLGPKVSLTFEEYVTVFTQIEAILNSRPFSYRQTSNENAEIITPAHLAIGRTLLTIVEPSEAAAFDRRYLNLRNIIASFWSSWRIDYLASLPQKQKWKTSCRNLAVNDVVLLRDDNAPPAAWPMAIVTEVFPDRWVCNCTYSK